MVILGGPTAVGKSACAKALIERINGVIVNGDATKIYKDLNIGSNKFPIFGPESSNIRMIDIVRYDEQYNVGEYFKDARREIESIIEENKVPIVVGGSGLYLRWLLYGKQSGPMRDEALSESIIKELKTLPWGEVRQRVAVYDMQYAQMIAENDYRRAARAIEIGMMTGKPISAFNEQNLTIRRGGELEAKDCVHLDYDFRCFTLTKSRISLYDRISYRCEDMVANGLLKEVWELMKQGFNTEFNAGKAVGYKQSIEFLQSKQFHAKAFASYLNNIKSKSRQLAHRQLSWFRSEPLYHWVDCTNSEDAINEILKCYNMNFATFHEYRKNSYKISTLHTPEENDTTFRQYTTPHYIYTAKHISKSEIKRGVSNEMELRAQERVRRELQNVKDMVYG